LPPAVVVLVYIYTGGLTSAIYNEVLQFFLIVLGFAPLVILGLQDIGGWNGLMTQLGAYSATKDMPGAWSHSWQYMGNASANPIGIEWFGLVAGLGFVLSFGYWCTDFLVIQRAMAAKDMNAARRTPLIAAVPKMLFPALVILPGMLAIALYHRGGTAGLALPVDARRHAGLQHGRARAAREVFSQRHARHWPHGADGLVHVGHGRQRHRLQHGLDLRPLPTLVQARRHRRPPYSSRPPHHHRRSTHQRRLRLRGDKIQQHHGHAPVGVRLRERAALCDLPAGHVLAPRHRSRRFFGLLVGTLSAAAFQGNTLPTGETASLLKGGWMGLHHTFASSMAQNFWMAIFAFTGCFVATIVISLATAPNRTDDELRGLVYSLTEKPQEDPGARGIPNPLLLA
jgi:SSS family solute:Na+ symporter